MAPRDNTTTTKRMATPSTAVSTPPQEDQGTERTPSCWHSSGVGGGSGGGGGGLGATATYLAPPRFWPCGQRSTMQAPDRTPGVPTQPSRSIRCAPSWMEGGEGGGGSAATASQRGNSTTARLSPAGPA